MRERPEARLHNCAPLPFLISDFRVAMTAAVLVVVIELGITSSIRHRYMETPAFSAALQVGLGGILVFVTGVLIGSAAGFWLVSRIS